MRDFRNARAMAQTIRAALAAKGVKLSIGESLELVAKALGVADWNTLSAAIRAARTDGSASVTPAVAPDRTPEPNERVVEAVGVRRGTFFSGALEATLHRAVALAQARSHSHTTLEHLLLALIDDSEASAVLDACQADAASLKAQLTSYIDDDLLTLVAKDADPVPTAGFHRVVQRAVIHVQSSGRGTVTGANILVAVFSERESRACHVLTELGLTRYDAVNFIAHGVRKGDAPA